MKNIFSACLIKIFPKYFIKYLIFIFKIFTREGGKQIKARDSQRRFAPFNFNMETCETPSSQAELSNILRQTEESNDRQIACIYFSSMNDSRLF